MENFEKPEIKKQGIFVLHGRTRRVKVWLVLFGLVTYRIFTADKVLWKPVKLAEITIPFGFTSYKVS